jgi:hypothetical protein
MGVGYPPLDVHSQVRTGRCRFFVEVLTILCRDTVAVTIHPQHGEPFGATLVSNDAGISGWRAGPHGMHQERYFNTSGEPTGLVRNDGFESLADLPPDKGSSKIVVAQSPEDPTDGAANTSLPFRGAASDRADSRQSSSSEERASPGSAFRLRDRRRPESLLDRQKRTNQLLTTLLERQNEPPHLNQL